MEKHFIYIKDGLTAKSYFHIDTNNNPFFSILYDTYTTKSFINLIKQDSFLDARGFMSSVFKQDFDISILKEYFNEDYLYKKVDKISFYENEKVNSFLIMDKKQKIKGVINFYMVNEPDRISKWKIYRITKEAIK